MKEVLCRPKGDFMDYASIHYSGDAGFHENISGQIDCVFRKDVRDSFSEVECVVDDWEVHYYTRDYPTYRLLRELFMEHRRKTHDREGMVGVDRIPFPEW